jgi:hypothetical protein
MAQRESFDHLIEDDIFDQLWDAVEVDRAATRYENLPSQGSASLGVIVNGVARFDRTELERVAIELREALNDPRLALTEEDYERINRTLLDISDAATHAMLRCRHQSDTAPSATKSRMGARTYGNVKRGSPTKKPHYHHWE